MTIRDTIRQAVKADGRKQEEIAAAAGLTQPELSRYLTGRRDMLTHRIERLASALGLSLQPTAERPAEDQ